MTANEKVAKYRKEHLEPMRLAARKFFRTHDGKILLDGLDRVFSNKVNLPTDNNGAVDANAVLVNAGAGQVIQYLRDLAKEIEDE